MAERSEGPEVRVVARVQLILLPVVVIKHIVWACTRHTLEIPVESCADVTGGSGCGGTLEDQTSCTSVDSADEKVD